MYELSSQWDNCEFIVFFFGLTNRQREKEKNGMRQRVTQIKMYCVNNFWMRQRANKNRKSRNLSRYLCIYISKSIYFCSQHDNWFTYSSLSSINCPASHSLSFALSGNPIFSAKHSYATCTRHQLRQRHRITSCYTYTTCSNADKSWWHWGEHVGESGRSWKCRAGPRTHWLMSLCQATTPPPRRGTQLCSLAIKA